MSRIGCVDTRVGRAVALLLDALLERRVAHELVDDGASQLAAHVFRQLGAVDLSDTGSGELAARD